METTSENQSEPEIDGPDSPTDQIDRPDSLTAPEVCNYDHVLAELDSLRQEYQSLQSRSATSEDNLLLLQQEKDKAVNRNSNLMKMMEELSRERDTLRDKIVQLEAAFKKREEEFAKKIDEEVKEKEELKRDIEVAGERIEILESDKKERDEFILRSLDLIKSVKENLVNIVECLDDEKVIEREDSDTEPKLGQESRALWEEIKALTTIASKAEAKVSEYKEVKRKDIKELGNSVVSLTEENRDINSLLRIALVEKEAVEKSLSRLKGNSEQKRVALLQIAERGLQRVGFGFMMGSGSNEQPQEGSGANVTTPSNKSDSSECEEEVVSVASTVERIMKNLRLEISQLRKSLEESRSDTERLQSLTVKQAKTIEENMLYIKELEDRERVLAQSVEELLLEIKATEEDVARWREACELEVEAGKSEIEERDKVVDILKQELEKTKAALDLSNNKLKVKEELAAAAMTAQAAAETSLQLADSRAAGLCEQIEKLTKQLEEAESKERSRNKVRHICWPWRVFRLSTANNTNGRVRNVKRMLPEMQALLHYNV
ncbi:putative ATP binding protein [Melia azedarach]|uniref:ATP binding protein n=1 Tax=Melia azedarach TaxID=155640 RepID=A0ACC1X746_MELAZ|nr:putative ATP binding protein [Melia azedarach]